MTDNQQPMAADVSAARAELDEAGRRQAEIDKILEQKKKELRQLHDLRRVPAVGAAGQQHHVGI